MRLGTVERSTRFLSFSCVAGIALLAFGCGRIADESQPPRSAGTLSDDNSRLRDENAPRTPFIEPGTPLAKVEFKKTLLETEARFIVIQVYMEACGPCMTEALRLQEKRDEWRESGVAVLGMGMDETPDGAKAFFRHTGERITYPLYMAPWFSEQQKVFATPTMFIYGADGEQLFRTDPETSQAGVMAALDTKLTELRAREGAGASSR